MESLKTYVLFIVKSGNSCSVITVLHLTLHVAFCICFLLFQVYDLWSFCYRKKEDKKKNTSYNFVCCLSSLFGGLKFKKILTITVIINDEINLSLHYIRWKINVTILLHTNKNSMSFPKLSMIFTNTMTFPGLEHVFVVFPDFFRTRKCVFI